MARSMATPIRVNFEPLTVEEVAKALGISAKRRDAILRLVRHEDGSTTRRRKKSKAPHGKKSRQSR